MYEEEILELRGKLQKLCTTNGYELEVSESRYPIRFILTEEGVSQTSILTDSNGEVIEPAVISISFGSDVCVRTKGRVAIGADDLKKIISTTKELQYLLLQAYFHKNTTIEEDVAS